MLLLLLYAEEVVTATTTTTTTTTTSTTYMYIARGTLTSMIGTLKITLSSNVCEIDHVHYPAQQYPPV